MRKQRLGQNPKDGKPKRQEPLIKQRSDQKGEQPWENVMFWKAVGSSGEGAHKMFD